MPNLRDLIQQARDVEVVPVDVPEWGCRVYLRQLSVRDRLALMQLVTDDNAGKLSVYCLLYTLCDEAGTLVFGSDDYDTLAAKNAKVVDRLGRRAAEINHMTGDAVEAAKECL